MVSAVLSCAVLGLFLAIGGAAHADGGKGVQEANATCSHATAILLVGDGQSGDARWSMIRKVVASKREWVVSDSAQPSTVGSVALTTYTIKHTYKGGPTVAYTVDCGHGGTCNDVANEFAKTFPAETPAPAVFCDVSNLLENPTPAR
jgi:hypothetical protein